MAGIGSMRKIVLERWTQAKNATGSLEDTLTTRYPIYADIRDRGGSRSYEDYQTKLSSAKEIRIYYRDPFDITAQWKVVFDGRRYTVSDVQKVNEAKFNYLLLIDTKQWQRQ